MKIATVKNPSVKDYSDKSDISYEDVDGTEQVLSIDQQKYFAFKVDDVDKIQSSIPLLEAATEGAGFSLADTLDLYLAGIVKGAGTLALAPVASEKGLELLARVMEAMDKAKAPDVGRWVVIPPSFAKTLVLELADKLTNNADIVTSGYLGTVFGLNIYKSSNVENLLVGHTSAVTVASQISETESLRLPNTFATGIRGLHVYGAKVTRPALCGEIEIG